jgi:acetylornithine deacetylase/succinyl-diaminopimelate desuccinylase-like protein
MEQALGYARSNWDDFLLQLEDFLRIPSISTDSSYAGEVRRCAVWLAAELERVGIQNVEVCKTAGHPIVVAEHVTDPSLPTVLIYGHYDVQPPDPLEEWNSPPFEPVRKDGVLYARGACDDKGQLFMHVKAAESFLQSGDRLPVNLKYLFEGEEESGSEHLADFIRTHASRLDADIVAISDTAMFAEGVPSLTMSLRGLAYVEVTLRGPDRDLHSGVYGGGVENPISALSRLIAGLHDDDHRITIPGFYDDVRPMTAEDRRLFAELPHDDEAWKQSIGVPDTRSETGYSVLEATNARPALDVNGIWGGYQGEGAKTVLPATASAKISMRLVPDQDPPDITAKIRRYFEENTPSTMQLAFRDLHDGRPMLVDTTIPAMQAAADAMEAVYGRKPYFTRDGGSIPVVADFKEIMGLDTVLMGFGLNSDAIHSPNEHFALSRFREGVESIIRFMDCYSRIEARAD